MRRRLAAERFYPYSPERVWRALTDPKLLSQWLMMTYDFQPKLGGRFQFHATHTPLWDGMVDCEIKEIEEGKLLSYTWVDGWRARKGGKPVTITWTLEPCEGGTTLRLQHEGFESYGTFLLRSLASQTWGAIFQAKLSSVIERQLPA